MARVPERLRRSSECDARSRARPPKEAGAVELWRCRDGALTMPPHDSHCGPHSSPLYGARHVKRKNAR